MPDGEKWTGKGSKHRIEGAAARKKYGDNLRAIYGTRVKIPPPGPEREELAGRIEEMLHGGEMEIISIGLPGFPPERNGIELVLRALEEMEG